MNINRKKREIFFIVTILLSFQKKLFGSEKLEFDNILHAQIAIETSIRGVYRDGKKLITLPERPGFFIDTTYNFDATDRFLVFGDGTNDTANSKRIYLGESYEKSFLRGLVPIGDDHYLLIDSKNLMAIYFNHKKNVVESAKSIVIDMLKPPKDSRGEPITTEVRANQKKFLKAYKAIEKSEDKIVGIIPEPLASNKGNRYLVATQMAGFPFILMGCDPVYRNKCRFLRNCFVSGMRDIKSDSIVGLTYSKKKNRMYIADQKRNKIVGFWYKSCYRVDRKESFGSAKNLRSIGGLFIDSEESLWVATLGPDNYKDASVYRWKNW